MDGGHDLLVFAGAHGAIYDFFVGTKDIELTTG